jgi:hypothetical protein
MSGPRKYGIDRGMNKTSTLSHTLSLTSTADHLSFKGFGCDHDQSCNPTLCHRFFRFHS